LVQAVSRPGTAGSGTKRCSPTRGHQVHAGEHVRPPHRGLGRQLPTPLEAVICSTVCPAHVHRSCRKFWDSGPTSSVMRAASVVGVSNQGKAVWVDPRIAWVWGTLRNNTVRIAVPSPAFVPE